MVPRTKFGCLGRKPVDKARLHALPRLQTFLAGDLPPPPQVCNYISGVPSWGVMLNDQIGDCEVAAAGHLQMLWTNAAAGEPIAIADADILAAYIALTGYDPTTGANDNGVATIDLLNYWMTVGIGRNKIGGYVALDPTNHIEVMNAIYLFGGVLAGVNLPQSAEAQTDAGEPWSPVWWSPTLGGHAVMLGSYGPAGTEGITWGQVQRVEWAFTDRQCDELYVVLNPEFFNSEGKTPTGLDEVGLKNAMTILGSVAPTFAPSRLVHTHSTSHLF